MYPDLSVEYLDMGINDHVILMLIISSKEVSRRTFKFWGWLTEKEEFRNIVSSSWNIPIVGSSIHILVGLKKVKVALQKWSSNF